MKRLTQQYLLLTVMIIIGLPACKKFVEIPPPKNQLVQTTVFADSLGATAAINGVYINMMQYFNLTFSNGGITLYTGLSGDELIESANNPDDAEFYNNSINVNNSPNQQLWQIAYQIIYNANACVEGIKNGSNINQAAKNSLTGEALVIRSLVYFNLTNLYGAVPLVTSTDYNKTRLQGRTAIADVYTQLINDLKTAQTGLSKQTGNNTRANYYAATALLARIYLYQGLYAASVTESDKIINSGNFSLVPDLNNVFLTGSNETIWSLAPVQPNKQTNEGYYFAPTVTTVVPTYVITNTLYNSFESGDIRKTKWINANVVAGQVYPYPYKYKQGRSSNPVSENYTVFRLAEQYLIEAEAKANSSDLAGALIDLNIVRDRAGLPNFQGTDKQSVINAVISERQHELFCEWGNRWYDIKRLNLSSVVFGSEKVNWKSTSNLFPIPQTEITADPALTQNTGY